MRARPRSLRRRVTAVTSVLIALVLATFVALVGFFLLRAAKATALADAGRAVCRPDIITADSWYVVASEALVIPGSCRPWFRLKPTPGDEVQPCAASTDILPVRPPAFSLWPLTDPGSVEFPSVTKQPPNCASYLDLVPSDDSKQQTAQAQRTLNNQMFAMLGGALLLTVLGTAVVWFTAGRVLRPVEAIRREVSDITEHDLARRVPVPGSRNEIARLATTVNETLDRLQTAVEDNRRFVADASHELRGPIAALRAELEIAHEHPDLTDWPAVVDGALQDTYRLQSLATDLLLLARLDHGSTTMAADVDLAEVVREEASGRDRAIAVEVGDEPVVVRGNRSMLTRLLANLLDNAEQHSTSATVVRLSVVDGNAVLDVVDDGPGVPPEDRERIFDRFTRLDDARTREAGGTGLGLAIARRIATAHQGTLRVADEAGVGWFTARFPLA